MAKKIRFTKPPPKIFIIERRRTDKENKKRRKLFKLLKQRGINMTTITKTITDRYGNTASFYKLEIGDVSPDLATGDISAPNYQLHVYKDAQAYADGYALVDCLEPRLPISITQTERDAETGSNDVEKQYKAFLRKATVSVLDGEGNETNLFDGRVRDVSFVGCNIE